MTLTQQRPATASPAEVVQPLATQRLRLAAVCMALVTLVFSQSAGKMAPDTKLDLVVNPLRLLGRALTLWDPTGASGQLQNQGYGYLFPIGPFYLFGHAIGLSAWEVQRSWQAALVVAAFLGATRLARLLGVESFWAKVAAGLAYALAPRILSELGSISSELMPVAALPWVVIPLVAGSRGGSPRRAAARSGVALLFAGGVNAAATLAILPVPALWLLTRARGPRRRALMGWWSISVVLACAWWLVPLLLLGKYSPPFLDWIEPSALTTRVTSLLAALRGVDHWVGYLGPSVWPAGWILIAAPAVVVATAGVAAAGVAGLARADLPHRTFLRATLVVGLILLTAGHLATVGPAFAGDVRTLLDGPLNAFRNIHKFDPVVRLPLAIGLGHLLASVRLPRTVRRQIRGTGLDLALRPLGIIAVVGLGIVAVSPVITGRLMPQPRAVVDASWWSQTATWLHTHSDGGRALIVPGSPRPVYVWGAPVDDAIQPVAESPWAARDAVPLTQAGYIRMLDSVEQSLAAGRGDPTLAGVLARSGMRYLVVRNDLETAASQATPLLFVHATIANSPGLRPVAAFGPGMAFPPDPSHLLDVGATVNRQAVEIYEVQGWTSRVTLQPTATLVHANGSSDQLDGLVARGVGGQTPVVFGADAPATAAAATVATDGIRRRQADFRTATGSSATMTANQPYGSRRAAYDYLPDNAGPLSTMTYGSGLADVTASSSGADAGALINVGRGNGPWAALDGDPGTSWKSGAFSGAIGQWLDVRLTRPLVASTVGIAFAPGLGSYPSRVSVRTDTGTQITDVSPGPSTQPLGVPNGATRSLRITVLAATGGHHSVGITALTLPGFTPTRSLHVPIDATPQVLAFGIDPGARGECLTVNGRAACDPAFDRQGEEDNNLSRSFTLSTGAQYVVTAGVTMRDGAALNRLLDTGRRIRATSKSGHSSDPRERSGAAVDGDPFTSWVASTKDLFPTLTVRLPKAQVVRRLVLTTDAAAPVARAQRVRIAIGLVTYVADVPANGLVTLPHPVRGSSVKITVLRWQLRVTSSTLSGAARALPVGISEVRINGVVNPPESDGVAVGCAAGVYLLINGQPIAMQIVAGRAAVLAGDQVTAFPCGPSTRRLAAGPTAVSLPATPLTLPRMLTFTAPGTSLATTAPVGTASVLGWGATHRTVRVDSPSAAVLAVPENFNLGWTASAGGHTLRSVRLDGWQQGWVVPAGTTATVVLDFAPQTPFAAGVLAGGVCALLLLLLAFLRPRRGSASPPLDDRDFAAPVVAVGLGVAAVLLAGLAGLAIAVVAWLASAGLRRVDRTLPYWLGGALIVAGGVADAVTRAGDESSSVAGSPLVQVLSAAGVLLLVTALLDAAVLDPSRLAMKSGRENRRNSGRSKK